MRQCAWHVPRLRTHFSPLGANSWLACGTAAMAFDPICGDGTAHAIREAILAAAVIRALANGGPADELLAHYEARLTAGFHRHLTLCRQFYLVRRDQLVFGAQRRRPSIAASRTGVPPLWPSTPVSAISCEAWN